MKKLTPLAFILILVSGCSLEREAGYGFKVRLAPAPEALRLFGTRGDSPLGLLAFPDFNSQVRPLRGFSDLSCFFVNVRSGALSPFCGGNIQRGFMSAPQGTSSSTFEITAAIDGDPVFEAYAADSSSCGAGGTEPQLMEGATVYPIGALSSAGSFNTVTIPVSLEVTRGFNCDATKPFLLFSDTFNYDASITALGNAPAWTTTSGAIDGPIPVVGGKLAGTNVATISPLASTLRMPISDQYKYVRISLRYSFPAGTSPLVMVSMGGSDGVSPATGVFCDAKPVNQVLRAGRVGLPSTNNTFSGHTVGTFVCERRIDSNGDIDVRAALFGTGNSLIAEVSGNDNNVASSAGTFFTVNVEDGGGSNIDFQVDDLVIEASNSTL